MPVDPQLVQATERWFEKHRGITPATLQAFGIEVVGSEDDKPVIAHPYTGSGRRKLRVGLQEKYFKWDPPGQGAPPIFRAPDENLGPKEYGCLFEGESDMMAFWQNLPEEERKNFVLRGLSGVNTWQKEFADEFEGCKYVYVFLDNDDPYEKKQAAEAVDETWNAVRASLGRRARRVSLAQEKDVCEFFLKHRWAAMDELLKIASRPVLFLKDAFLNLKEKPDPPGWLVEGVMANGDSILLHGEEGTGKSVLAQHLAVTIANGDDTWLGQKIDIPNRTVCYVDKENPIDLVYERMEKFGLTEDGMKNLHYIYYPEVLLDENPEVLLHDMEELNMHGGLIIIDSRSRFHIHDEKEGSEGKQMHARFVQKVTRPPRESGLLPITTLIIHHDNRMGEFRGHSDIRGAVDLALHVKKKKLPRQRDVHNNWEDMWSADTRHLTPAKPRRGQKLALEFKIVSESGKLDIVDVTPKDVKGEIEKEEENDEEKGDF